MNATRRLLTEDSEEELIDTILEFAYKKHMTISNLKQIVEKAIKHLEDNAIL